MVSNFEYFKQQLDDAVELLESSDIVEKKAIALPNKLDNLVDTQSLLARCESVCNKYESNKPTIRVIHHLACTGGTLISKCISALPNVFLLSEVHPNSKLFPNEGGPVYLPSDISSLCKYANIPHQSSLANEIFLGSINQVYEHVKKNGGTLVLREHTHSDFHVGEKATDTPSVRRILSDKFNIRSLLTIRDPIDSYLSLLNNNWKHFSPCNFEEYCARIIKMHDCYKYTDVIRYEDFVDSPEEMIEKVCDVLELTYSELFIDLFSMEIVTGDSGRSASYIAKRTRREVSDSFKKEIKDSKSYKVIKESFGY